MGDALVDSRKNSRRILCARQVRSPALVNLDSLRFVVNITRMLFEAIKMYCPIVMVRDEHWMSDAPWHSDVVFRFTRNPIYKFAGVHLHVREEFGNIARCGRIGENKTYTYFFRMNHRELVKIYEQKILEQGLHRSEAHRVTICSFFLVSLYENFHTASVLTIVEFACGIQS